MKPRQLILGGALALAAALAWFADKAPSNGVAQAAERKNGKRATAPAAGAKKTVVADAVSEPLVLAVRPRTLATHADGGVFLSQDWTPPAPAQSAAAEPAPKPVAPPLPFVFIGKAGADGVWAVFLARADQTYVVRAHTVIDASYRVEQIAPPLMTITYLPLNEVQQLNIGVPD
jgi:hypothetical protein